MVGKLIDGLYVFDPPHFQSSQHSISQDTDQAFSFSLLVNYVHLSSYSYALFTLWHNRLGHPTFKL